MAPGQLWLGTQPIRDWRSLADLGIALVLIPANEKFGDPGSASHLAMTWNLAAKFAFPGPREGLIAMATNSRQVNAKNWHCTDPKYWRRLEAETRVIALTLGDPESKRVMLLVAAGYKRLAERTEIQKANQFIDGAAFGPEALKAMGEAFDKAWREIAGNFGYDRVEVEAVRLKLATEVLTVASEDSRNAQVLKQAALQRMALDYRSL